VRKRRLPPALALLLCVAALASVAWSLVVPLLQGPDEGTHLARVGALADSGVLVPSEEDAGKLPRELIVTAVEGGLVPLVGNLSARPAWTEEDEARWTRAMGRLGDEGGALVQAPRGTGVGGTNRYPPLYYAYVAAPYEAGGSFLSQVHLARLANLPLLLACVALTWVLAAELLPGVPWARPLAAGIVALEPQLAFLSGVVNPDLLLVALFTGGSLAAVRTARDGLRPGRAAALLGTSVAATLTHPRGVVLLLVAALAVALGARHRRSAPLGALALALVALGGLVALVGGRVLGVPILGTGEGAPFQLRELLSYLWQFYLPALPFMEAPLGGEHGFREVWVQTFFGTFASLEVGYATWVYDLLQAVVLGLLGLFVVALARHRRRVLAAWPAVVVLGGLVVVLVGGLHLTAYRLLLLEPGDPVITGRHVLPLISIVAVAAAAAGRVLPRRAGPYYAATLLAGLALLHLSGLGLTVARFYA